MPVIEVSVPEAAPVKVAKNGAKGKGTKLASKPSQAKLSEAKPPKRVADASGELPKLAAAKAVGPKLAAAKSFTLASAGAGQDGRGDQRTARSRSWRRKRARSPRASKVAAKEAKPAAKTAAKTPAKAATKLLPKLAAKPQAKAETKVAAKPAAKPAAKSKQATGKRVKLAAVR